MTPIIYKLFDAKLVWTKLMIIIIVTSLLNEQSRALTGGQVTINDDVLYESPDQGGPRRFEVKFIESLIIYKKPSLQALELTGVSQGEIIANLGCEGVGNQVWCQVQLLHGKKRGFALAEFLVPAAGPDGVIPMGVDDSARRSRKGDHDGREQIRCAQVIGQPMTECLAEVSRSDGGDAAVLVTFSNDFKRTLYFLHGNFISANATMSGVGTDTDWQIKDGVHYIRVDDQRYEIADAFILDRLPVNKTE